MSTEVERRNKALVLQMYTEVWNKGNIDFINQVVSPDFKDHPPKRFEEVPAGGRESLVEAVKNFRAAMPDFHDQMIQVTAEGDRVYYLGRMTGTHSAPYLQHPASGNKVNVLGISGFRLENGMVVERWGIYDVMGMMRQMGIVPAAPGAH